MRLALAWMALVLALLFMPAEHIISPPEGTAFAGHVVLFGVSGVLWGRAFPRHRGVVFAALLALAVATELGQGVEWIGRGAQPQDLVADAVGLVLAGLALRWTQRPRAAV